MDVGYRRTSDALLDHKTLKVNITKTVGADHPQVRTVRLANSSQLTTIDGQTRRMNDAAVPITVVVTCGGREVCR